MEASFHEMELLSRSLSNAHRAAVQAELNAAGLEKVGHPLLVSILQSADEDPEGQCQAQRELADLLHVSPPAVANSLKCLERDGYVRREPWPRDARRNRVILTEKGAAAVEGCREVFVRVSDRMLAGFSREELALLAQFQRRMLDNLTNSHKKE
ncbi:MarR family transcriptional regulator [Colidextribacter sp. OB.20]|uniref:MarR family transcriptional regulator n=1 Tax=Colidextribacter sp. OB.20 TaxID=2304568 RepID=UPI00137064D0